MRRKQLNTLLTGGLVLAFALGIAAGWLAQQDAELQGALALEAPRPVGDFALLDQHGVRYGPAEAGGRWQLYFFGFTHCPDICPSTLSVMRQTAALLPPALRAQLRFAMVSVDPARDRPQVLKPYLAHFSADFTGLTGDEAQIEAFASRLGAAYVRVPQGETYTVDHSTALVLVNPALELVAFFPAPHRAETLAEDLRVLLERHG